uniref:taste receptor type 1 member 3 n=1 Tax=Jaculus jaculus TaxID=51337 RepID=UPI001E1B0D4D|nr:taste receptor type 1 member 3 [Jaculus jaculus]
MLSPAVLSLSLAAALGLSTGASLCLSRQFRVQGDYMLGGLFPLGSTEETTLHQRTQPNGIPCTRFLSRGLFLVMAMKMAVEEINNRSSLLPGLNLGYDLFDTCLEPVVTMKPSLMFLAKAGSSSIAAYCNYTQYQPRVLAVIGPHSSELALITGKFFSFFLMPQVSYSASMDRLSDRETFPSFFRTVPSDKVQLEAIVKLLQHFEWNWVAALGSDDDYGREGLGIFSGLANARGICIAHEGLITVHRASDQQPKKMVDVLHQVNQSKVQVVVLFASVQAVYLLLNYSIHYGLSPKVWVASDSWLTSDQVMTLPRIAQVGTVLGFLQRGDLLPEFPHYVQTHLALASNPAFCASLDAEIDLDEHVMGPRCPHCDDISLPDLSSGLLLNMSAEQLNHQVFATYAAVYSVAQALHNTLQCNASSCPATKPVQPWQLLKNMYNMSFQAGNLTLQFDASGSVHMEYDLKMWVWESPTPVLHTVGTFNGSLQLQHSKMHWPGNQVPVSQCSRQCKDGQVRRVKGFHSCCYDCVDCKAGSYQNSDNFICTLCGPDQWSPEQSTSCFPRRPKFLAWGEPAVLSLLLLLGLVLGLVLGALGLFVHSWNSPLVQASGGPLFCFGLVCLGLFCLSVLLFPGQPSPASCLAQQPLAHLPLTGCLSTLFLQAAETFVESELPLNWATWLCAYLQRPWAWLVVLLAILVEAALCAWYLAAFPPVMVKDQQVLPTETLEHCHMHSWVSLGLVHITNATLAFLCFLGTFLVQSQPGRYNRARGITFAMLSYFIIWVSFVPILANVQVTYQPAVQMGAILLCALGILATFHLPKCYLLLWLPKLNTWEFFLGGGHRAEGDGSSDGGRDGTQGHSE